MAKCLYCGKEFTPKRKDHKFHIKACQDAYWAQKRRERDTKIREYKKRFKMQTCCPWAAGLIEGTARNADPVLGF